MRRGTGLPPLSPHPFPGLRLPASASLALGAGTAFSWSAWVKPDAPQNGTVLFVKRDGASALIIGLGVGVVCYFSSVWVKKWIGYDDALDCWGVHGVGGAFGAIMTGAFASKAINSSAKGWLYDGNAHQMLVQFYDVAAVFIYCGVGTFVILKLIDLVIGLRVTRDVEVEGLDINLHGEVVHD